MALVLATCDATPSLWNVSDDWMRCPGGWKQIDFDYTEPSTGGETNTVIVYEVPPPVDLNQLDPTMSAAMYSAGFALSFTPFFAAFAIRQILKLIH